MKKFLFFLFIQFATFNLFPATLKYSYSITPTKIYINQNYFTYLSIKNLRDAIFFDLKLEKFFSLKEQAEILKIVLKNISLSQNTRFTFFSAVDGRDLIVTFTILESAFKKARYFILVGTNYDSINSSILEGEDLKKSYAKWFFPVLGELVYFKDSYQAPEIVAQKIERMGDLELAEYYLLDSDVENDDEVMKNLENGNMKYDQNRYIQLFYYYIIYEKNLEKAQSMLAKIEDKKTREEFELYKIVKSFRESKFEYKFF